MLTAASCSWFCMIMEHNSRILGVQSFKNLLCWAEVKIQQLSRRITIDL